MNRVSARSNIFCRNNLEEAWAVTDKLSVHPDNAGGFAALIEVEELEGKKRKFLLDSWLVL